MFEDSLVESRVGHVSSSRRWTAFVSISLQCALAALVIALPLLHPEALSLRVFAPRVLMPLPPKPPMPVPRVRQVEISSASPTVALPETTRAAIFRTLLPDPGGPVTDAPGVNPVPFGSGMGDGVPSVLGDGDAHSSRVLVRQERSSPLRVSSGISQGMLLTPIRPVYPSIAKAAGVQGTVVVEAVISRAGTIESLRVMSGPAMLQQVAVDAIRAARYQPYRLNGDPTEVQTTITVNFRMGG